MHGLRSLDHSATIKSVANANLLIVGGCDEGAVQRGGTRTYSGITDLCRLLAEEDEAQEFHIGANLRNLPWVPDLKPFQTILNLLTDPDQNPRSLDNLRKLLRGYRGKVINHPDAVLRTTRDQVARLLTGIPGLIVPKVVRLRNPRPELVAKAVERAGLSFPVILRLAGTHTGKIIGLVENLEELQAKLGSDGDHVATEFVDYRGVDGAYCKYRVFFFGERAVFRHMLFADQWNIHARDGRRFMTSRPNLIEREEAMFDKPEGKFPQAVRATLEVIRKRMRLDFFGVDFGLTRDGRTVLFEANATMNFFTFYDDPRFSYLDRVIAPAQAAFRGMLGLGPLPPGARPPSGIVRRR